MVDEKYKCSKHGSEGHPDCEECLANLKKLAKDNNAHLVGEEECLKK